MREKEHKFVRFVERAVSPFLHCFSNQNTGAVVSDDVEDTRLSFDMRVGLWVPVSVRLRSAYYFKKWPGDFSIRSKTKYSGQIINWERVLCEMDKLLAGMGNCYFYGWLSGCGEQIENYMIVDVNRFRRHLHTGQERNNGDGTAGTYYNIEQLRMTGSLVFQSWEEDQQKLFCN